MVIVQQFDKGNDHGAFIEVPPAARMTVDNELASFFYPQSTKNKVENSK
jgi:hypothetical protein